MMGHLPALFVKPPAILDRPSHGLSTTARSIAKEPVSAQPKVVFWYKKKKLTHIFCNSIELLPNGGLSIKQVRQRDAGTYRCTAGNTLGKISAPAQLRVLSKSTHILLDGLAAGSLFWIPSREPSSVAYKLEIHHRPVDRLNEMKVFFFFF